jgi:hypothetical protein
MKIQNILLIIVTLLFVAACSPENLVEIEETTPFDTPYEEVQEEAPTQEPAEVEETAVEIIQPSLNSQIQELVDKNADSTNYYYKHVGSHVNEGGSVISEKAYIAHINGNKAKLEYTETRKFGGDFFYNEVYLNTETKEAIGVCTRYGVSCQEIYETGRTIDYENVVIGLTPLSVLKSITADASVVGDEKIDGRETTIIEFMNHEGHIERVSIDNFYELPVRRIVYRMVDDERVEVRKDSFPKLRVGGVKNVDITLPDNINFTG